MTLWLSSELSLDLESKFEPSVALQPQKITLAIKAKTFKQNTAITSSLFFKFEKQIIK